MRCALAQASQLPHTTFPTPPESAIVLPATRGLLPPGLPRASGQWPAHSALPTLPALPTSAGREGGSADWSPDVPRVVALLLAPDSHPLHAVRLPFHTDDRNPARSMPHQNSCVWRWPSRHSGGLLPTPLPRHSACTVATGRIRAKVRGLTSPQGLRP